MAEYNWWVKRRILPSIQNGSKTLEIRPAQGDYLWVKTGDIITFNGLVRCQVDEISTYPSVVLAINEDRAPKLGPGYTRQRVLNAVRGFYSKWNGSYLIYHISVIN